MLKPIYSSSEIPDTGDSPAYLVDRFRGFLTGNREAFAKCVSGISYQLVPHLEQLSLDSEESGNELNAIRGLVRGTQDTWLSWFEADGSEKDTKHRLVELSRYSGGTDAQAEADVLGVRIKPGENGRTRLIYQGETAAERVCLHIVMTVARAEHGEPHLAVRFLNSNEPEELALSFRTNSVVVAGQYPIPALSVGATRLYSLFLDRDEIAFCLDGVPLWYGRRSGNGPNTGFNFDLIGRPGSPGNVLVHAIYFGAIEANAGNWGFIDQRAMEKIAKAVLAIGDSELARCFYHSRGNRLRIKSSADTSIGVKQIISEQRAYPEPLVESLQLCHGGQIDIGVVPTALLEVESVGVRYACDPSGKKRLTRIILGKSQDMFNALQDVSFRAYPGDIIGIIGRNGAGKTTLLRAIQGSTPISNGTIRIRGNSLLLRPGTGMTGELTGRENIVRSALFMGYSPAQARALIPEVVEFSELAEHIDRPYRYYSDGMRARLIFALATTVSPDILMLDELLGAGDRGFQEKAMARLDEFLERPKVVLVVQHTLDFVLRRCTKCLYLKRGKPVFFGDPLVAAELYENE